MEGLVFLSLLVLAPAALMALARPTVRRVFLALGLIVALGIELVLNSVIRTPIVLLQVIAIGVVLGGLAIEFGTFAARLAKWHRSA